VSPSSLSLAPLAETPRPLSASSSPAQLQESLIGKISGNPSSVSHPLSYVCTLSHARTKLGKFNYLSLVSFLILGSDPVEHYADCRPRCC